MHSFRHYLSRVTWNEGPRISAAGAFIRTPPAGRMLRYQLHQLPDMLDRWRVHVEGWLDAIAGRPEITAVSFEDLEQKYHETMTRLCERKGWVRAHAPKPKIGENVTGESKRHDPSNYYEESDLEYFQNRIGPTMRRLGYDPDRLADPARMAPAKGPQEPESVRRR